jgi:hypothetical protein
VFTLNTLVTFTGVTVRYGKLTTDNQLGGGIFDEGFSNLTINDSVITQNRLEGDGSVGAGIFDEQGSLDISGSQITSNEMTGLPGTSLLGIAGIAKESGTMTMINSEVSGNQAPNASIGGLLNRETTLPTVVRNSTIANNFTGMAVGGAAFFGPTLIVNSTISGNTANANFGGVVGLDLNLVNVTITNNIADADNDGIGDGGGLGWESPAVIRVQNSIIAGNFDTPDNVGPGDIFPDVEGEFISQGHNLIGSDAGLGPGGTPFTDGVNGDMVGTSSEPLDALLSDLGDNGGATPTHLLLEGSPAIDAGDPTACADATLTSNEDQRGIARPINGDGEGAAVCDIGAVEVPFEGRVYLPLIAR